MIQNYDDLEVYQKSYGIALTLHEAVKKLPKEELFGLTGQIKRASLSIPLNIAEGYGKRASASEFKRYLMTAKGSCDEMKVLVTFCKDLKYIGEEEYEDYHNKYNEIGRMLNGLIKNWKTR